MKLNFHVAAKRILPGLLPKTKSATAEFADYLFMRDNPKGLFLERWRHSAGCRRWFNMARDTVSHDIVEIYPMGSPAGKNSHGKIYLQRELAPRYCRRTCRQAARASQKNAGKATGAK